MSTEEEVSKPSEGGDGGDMDMETGLGGNLNESDVETLAMCLEEVTKVLVLAPDMIVSMTSCMAHFFTWSLEGVKYIKYNFLDGAHCRAL